nr:hypothetical protein Itr_chr13CG16640 [Ipomoea trifida]
MSLLEIRGDDRHGRARCRRHLENLRRELQVATSATFAGEGTRRRLRKLASRLLLYHRRKGEELADIEAPTPETAIAAV